MSDTIVLTEEQINSIREKFDQYDVNKDGHIPTDKLEGVMRHLGYSLMPDELQDLIHLVDTDGSGTVEWDEFLPLMAAKLKEQEEMAFYKTLFRMLDKKKHGYIRCEDLKTILDGMATEVGLDGDQIDNLIAEVDEDGNGKVSFDEFYKLMTSD